MSFDFSAQSTEYKTTGMIYSVLIMPYLTNASPQIIKLTGSQLKERVTFVSPSLKPQIPYAFMCILTGFGWLRNISDYVNDRLCIAWLVCILTDATFGLTFLCSMAQILHFSKLCHRIVQGQLFFHLYNTAELHIS